ncbi:Exopolysaccharide biosynthesis protein YbjH [Paracoccus isoporae]|uniref:Exopolysaccharide biosynthesis protein YbjH n=1 Tax=Paracoccus isoporae TaxID=591205 RepID=A0A1G7E4T2_9RHOB|nr:YjbH domain-containing protein [Paracoccus isoporae]SDE58365.1 Exopolysaccharide biosynthesis protein YbjH [Paracoccus isoporae]
MRRRFRPLLLTSTALLTASVSALGVASPSQGQTLNSYGLPGAIDTPTAIAPPEGEIAATVSYSDYGRRVTLSFQPVPRLTGALRYSKIDGIDINRDALQDRSFDMQFQIFDEDEGWRPAVAVGLRDFMGTGVYSGEYLVATKTVTPRLRVTGGIGWGRLAGAWRQTDYRDEGGKPNVEDWFSGPAKPFASVEWQATDTLSVLAEYSHDDYEPEIGGGAEPPGGKFNLGVNYKIGDTYQIGAYTVGGDTFGIRGSVALNARNSPYPSGLEPAPAPVRPRPAPGADPEGWSGAWTADATARPVIQTALGKALRNEGQTLESMSLSANRAEVRISNNRYSQQAEAIGRTARLMTRALPPSVETFVITSVEHGVPTSSVVLRRSDVERLENTAAAHIGQRAQIVSADPRPGDLVMSDGLYPSFSWGIRPYVSVSLFDPDDPWRYEVGARASARYEIRPGLVLSGEVKQRAFGSIEQEAPGGLSVEEYQAQDADVTAFGVPRVRSDGRMYSGDDSPSIPRLTLAWFAKPTPTVYTRVTFGLLERAYGGVSAEALWKPVDSRLAIGAEVNHVRKREFHEAFEFRDYEVTTGHVSAYYDFGGGIWGQIDVGKYLAGDVGATVALNREFENGWRIGAFATKTDMSEEEFGEGSFDKGIRLSIPLSWATGTPSTQRIGGTIRSLSRDGGSRVRVDDRLYEVVRESHTGNLYDGWGKFWR